MKPPQQEQFEKAFHLYSEAIFRYCYFKVHDRELAKDLMHESFVKTWSYLQEGKEIENWQAFLYRIAHNLSINEGLRRQKHPINSLDAITAGSGFEIPDDKDLNTEQGSEGRLLLERIQTLDPEIAEILIMRFVDDLPVKDIAQILDLTENVTSVRIYRALKRLKKLYHE